VYIKVDALGKIGNPLVDTPIQNPPVVAEPHNLKFTSLCTLISEQLLTITTLSEEI